MSDVPKTGEWGDIEQEMCPNPEPHEPHTYIEVESEGERVELYCEGVPEGESS